MDKGKFFSKNMLLIRLMTGWIMTRSLDYTQRFSQADFASTLEISRRTIAGWETGHLPARTKANMIVEFVKSYLGFKITVDELMNVDLSENLIFRFSSLRVASLSKEYAVCLERLLSRVEYILSVSTISECKNLLMFLEHYQPNKESNNAKNKTQKGGSLSKSVLG